MVHDVAAKHPEHSIVIIENGHVTGRKVGDGASHVAMEQVRNADAQPMDHLSYLTKTPDGKILKSSTMYIRGKGGKDEHLLPDERIRTTLDAMGCEDIDLERAPHDLSGGQAARVALARTLLTDPKVLLADEVDAGLDDDNAAKVATIMADAAAHGMAIIRIRHRPPDGRATRTLTLDKGRLTEHEMTDPAAQDANAVSAGADENEETQA